GALRREDRRHRAPRARPGLRRVRRHEPLGAALGHRQGPSDDGNALPRRRGRLRGRALPDLMASAGGFKLALSGHPQEGSWNGLATAVRRADELGFDSLWTWDHLIGIGRDGRQAVFEAWATAAASAEITTRATIGLLVCANTLRHPALVA